VSINKSYSLYATFAAANVVISYGLLVFLANTLSKSDYATYGVMTTLMSLCLILLNFGHKEALFKYFSQGKATQIRVTSGSLKAWLLLFFSLSLCMFAISTAAGAAALAFWALYLLTVVSHINRGRGDYWRDAMALPLYRGSWLLAGLLVIVLGGSLNATSVFVLAALSSLLALVAIKGVTVLRNLLDDTGTAKLPIFNPTLRNFFLLEVTTVAYMKLDVLMLKAAYVDDELIAEYFFAIQVFEAAMLVLAPLSYLFFNRYNQHLKRRASSSLLKQVLPFAGVMLFVTVAIGGGWWLVGEWLLTLMFPDYVNSFMLVNLLLLALFPMGLSMLLSHALFAQDKEALYVKICAAGFLICLLGNAILIPEFAGFGAAGARLITELLIITLLLLTLPRMVVGPGRIRN
jgi:O-antigen/teichoic acid export membrane protein